MNRVAGRSRARRTLAAVVAALALGSAGLAATPAPAASAGTIAEASPAPNSPRVLDGTVRAVVRVGDRIVLGGSFTEVQESEDGAPVLKRRNLVAFDPDTGNIDLDFAPNPDATVHALEATADGEGLYVGGEFDRIAGERHPRLALVQSSNGKLVQSFDAFEVAGKVKEILLDPGAEAGAGRLWVAGAFTHIDGKEQQALATLDPATGAWDPFMSLEVSGQHHGGFTSVANIDLDGAGDRLVATGNFARVDGKRREQLVVLRIGGPRAEVTRFRTQFLETRCRRNYTSYVEEVAFSPDGSYFVVVTTGGARGDLSSCDATMRFETGASGKDVGYSWLDKTGGDSLYSVAVDESVVYVGGHPRWQNNSQGDNSPGPGAVARLDIAALDPDNGLPLSWDPLQDGGGQGIERLYLDPLGLWVGSDGVRVAGEEARRIVRFPDGGVLPAYEAPRTLRKIYLAGVPNPSGSPLVSRTQTAGRFGPAVDEPAGDVPWTELTGAFFLDGRLYTASAEGFQRRSFDGSAYGPVVAVDTSDQVVPLEGWHSDMEKMTAMFFDRGRVYFTKAGKSGLYYRYFTPESDVVGADRRVASQGVRGLDFSRVAGMALAGDHLYWTTPAGALKRVEWSTGHRAGRPVAGTVRTLSAPKRDGLSWKAGTILAPDPS